MLSPILGPFGVWVVAALAFAAACGFSFMKGMAYEGEKHLAAEAQRLMAANELRRVYVREVEKIVVKYVDRKAQRDAQKPVLMNEVTHHAQTIPDPAQCWLDPSRVRVINEAWGVGPAPDQRDQAATLRTTRSSQERKPQ
jgi:hypothetical protein